MSAQVGLWAMGAALLAASIGLAALAAWRYRALGIRGLRAELRGLSPMGPDAAPDVVAGAESFSPCRSIQSGNDAGAPPAIDSFRIVARQVITTCELGIEEL